MPASPVKPPFRNRQLIALIVGALAISFAAIFFRLAAPTHSIVAPAIRLLIAGGLLAPWIVYKLLRKEVARDVVVTASIGGVLYALHFGLWVTSLFFTSVAASVTLVTATPLLLGLYGVVSGKDAPTRRLWVAISVATFGVLLVAGGDFAVTTRALVGDVMALGGAAAIAIYFVFTRRLQEVDVFVLTGISSIVGGVVLFGVALIFGVDTTVPDHAWLYLFAAAAIPQLVGHSALFWALRYATPTKVGLATLGEPVFASVVAWLVLTEIPSATTIVGGTIVLSGVFLSFYQPKSAPR